ADASGNWSCPTTVATGPHTILAHQVDRASNRSNDSAPRTFSVEGLPNVLLNTPADITSGNAATYVVTGACTANAGNVSVNVGLISTQVPCANGMFSATLDVQALSDGTSITVRAAQTTAAGTGADTRTVNKDASPPMAPVVTAPANGSVTTNNHPPISGSAEPGSTVSIYLDGNLAGTAVANAQGQWTFSTPTGLADGTYEVTASATDSGGNTSARGTASRFTVDSLAPATPAITNPREGDGIDEDTSLIITGQAEALSTVIIYVDGREVGTTTADIDGRFSLPVQISKLGTGQHTVEAEARDAAGNTSPKSAPVRFSINQVDEKFGGRGLIGCSSAGGIELLALSVLLLARRRREVKP
ncbi:MAG: Ig-like domain-containing protein, partial [Archangium sp.]